jgi:hypothetical protein
VPASVVTNTEVLLPPIAPTAKHVVTDGQAISKSTLNGDGSNDHVDPESEVVMTASPAISLTTA